MRPFAMMLIAVNGLAGLPTAEAAVKRPLSGVYEITYRLELPHLERWAVAKTERLCLSGKDGGGRSPLPILSPNTPFATCTARNIRRGSKSLSYDIVCDGRDGARARAVYILTGDGFHGRVAMVLGAKNMTMIEVQSGRRLGDCDHS